MMTSLMWETSRYLFVSMLFHLPDESLHEVPSRIHPLVGSVMFRTGQNWNSVPVSKCSPSIPSPSLGQCNFRVVILKTIQWSYTENEIASVCPDVVLTAVPRTANKYELHEVCNVMCIKSSLYQKVRERLKQNFPKAYFFCFKWVTV